MKLYVEMFGGDPVVYLVQKLGIDDDGSVYSLLGFEIIRKIGVRNVIFSDLSLLPVIY